MTQWLNQIESPADLKNLSVEQLEALAEEIRQFITASVSQTGGHLASNLGVVELTIAMHRVFDFVHDRLLWDVGHQCYAHKILTGRRSDFAGLRQGDGLSGFPDPAESPYDTFRVGHAGTSIATALGLALGAQHRGGDERIVAFVGDASIVNGTSFEALNNLGLVRRQMLIVLNDNSMAIDITPGELAHTGATILITSNHVKAARAIINVPEKTFKRMFGNVSNVIVVWEDEPELADKLSRQIAARLRKFCPGVRPLSFADASDLEEDVVIALLKEDLYHFGFEEDLPISIQFLHTEENLRVVRVVEWMEKVQRAIRIAA